MFAAVTSQAAWMSERLTICVTLEGISRLGVLALMTQEVTALFEHPPTVVTRMSLLTRVLLSVAGHVRLEREHLGADCALVSSPLVFTPLPAAW